MPPLRPSISFLSNLVKQKGLDHAGESTGVGLGWIHILPIDSPSHIVEKTGGGAGFETYIAINHSRRTAIFLAATEGSVDTHLNLFNAANKLLLALAGLPLLPPPPPKPRSKTQAPSSPRLSELAYSVVGLPTLTRGFAPLYVWFPGPYLLDWHPDQ
jgi:hypothetical protein